MKFEIHEFYSWGLEKWQGFNLVLLQKLNSM
jgi:hypothetical protein